VKRFFCAIAMGVASVAPALAAKLSFENLSDVSIPLEIPGVMNPNLSPNSRSGVTLERGQKVYFKFNGRKTLLLEIRDENDGQVLVINELVAKRIAELEKKQ